MYTCIVKKIIVLISLTVALIACKSKKVKSSIQFEITTTEDYCGGAYPPDELVEDLRTPKVYTGKVYLHNSVIREDDGIVIDVVDGKCSKEGFVEGTYFLFLSPKMLKLAKETLSPANQERADCNFKENRKVLATIALLKNSTIIQQNLHKVCDPCLEPRP